MDTQRKRILFGLSGSVATIKVQDICNLLSEFAEVKVVSTKSALHFFDVNSLREKGFTVHVDEDEWNWKNRGDPVLHIELRKWADVMIIAPLSANTLAKMANGICDNLLTSVVRAWDFDKPLLVAPAMNTFMWDHPFTSKQLEILKELSIKIIPPVSKVLMCNDKGVGAMAEVITIVEQVKEASGIQ